MVVLVLQHLQHMAMLHSSLLSVLSPAPKLATQQLAAHRSATASASTASPRTATQQLARARRKPVLAI